MVLTGLVQSLQRLLRNIREATSMVSCGRDPSPPISSLLPSPSPSPVSVVAAAAAAAAATGVASMEVSCFEERPGSGIQGDRAFMGAARLLASRNPSSKRKLDELDPAGGGETSSQVRPRREEPEAGGHAESSGRQRRVEVDVGVESEQEMKDGGESAEEETLFGREKSDTEESSSSTSSSEIEEEAENGGEENIAMDVDQRSFSSSHLQFFVRTNTSGKSIVFHASASDTVESLHQQIQVRIGVPVLEQRLIFGGRQLQHDHTLEECRVTNDATLHLVGRMRSTALPHSWQLINDLVATIRRMYSLSGDQVSRLGQKLTQCQDSVRSGVQEFLKMAAKSVPVSEHMQVFQLSGATSALVMLLLSSIQSNRACAQDSIGFFLATNEDYLPAHLHCHSAPVLLEFCKLLSKSAPGHHLYPACRNALARLLDGIDTAHGSPCFHEVKAETIVSDFSPFVHELANSLLARLQEYESWNSASSRPDFSSYVKEAKDFTAFMSHLCKAMTACKVIERPEAAGGMDLELTLSCGTSTSSSSSSSTNVEPDDAAQVGSSSWLDSIFHGLLEVVNKCLTGVLGTHEHSHPHDSSGDRPFSRAPFLFLLKGLHAVAKLSSRARAKLLAVIQNQRSALNVLVQQSRWQEDDFWLLEYKCLLDFESKKRLVMAMLPEPQDDHDERQEIVVNRSQLLADSLEQLVYVESESIQGGLSVEFQTEEATGPGVLREWFFMVCKEIFNPQFALFLPCPSDRKRLFPNPASGVNPGHLTYFKFCGRVIALAMMHRVQIDVTFSHFFFKLLAGSGVTWEDAKDADPGLYATCKSVLEMDAAQLDSDALGLTFVTEVDLLGSRKTLELCPGGSDMCVNSSNRQKFVELMVQKRLVGSVQDQVKSFSQGFSDLLVNSITTQQFLKTLELDDLDLILYGKDRDISMDDWKQHTEYHDYKASDEQTQWFWEVVEGMPMERRRKLLFFATSITHLPPEGFAGLSSKFHIHKAFTDLSLLPTAHTCFYQLILPPYPSMEVMQRSLYAVTADHIAEGFGFA